jgi:hypothetical protein
MTEQCIGEEKKFRKRCLEMTVSALEHLGCCVAGSAMYSVYLGIIGAMGGMALYTYPCFWSDFGGLYFKNLGYWGNPVTFATVGAGILGIPAGIVGGVEGLIKGKSFLPRFSDLTNSRVNPDEDKDNASMFPS